MMALSTSVSQAAAPPYRDQERNLVATLMRSQYLETQDVSPEAILELTRAAFPNLPNRELGFAYYATAHAVLLINDLDLATHRYSASLFEIATLHYGSAMAGSESMFIRSLITIIRRGPCTQDERSAAIQRISNLLTELELFSLRLPIPILQVAHDWKLLAESLEFIAEVEKKNDEASSARWKAEYQRAASLYEIELQRLPGPDSTFSIKRGEILLNLGYCQYKSGNPGVTNTRLALEQFLGCKSPKHIVYAFKLLSDAYLSAANARLAYKCALSAVSIYEANKNLAHKADVTHAIQQSSKVEKSAFGRNGLTGMVLESNDPLILARDFLEFTHKSKDKHQV